MNKEEIVKKCNKITSDADRAVRVLKNTWSVENCLYGIGDIIQDHYHTIEVEEIKSWIFPNAIYIGTQLTKKLEPTKRQDDTRMYSSNVERKLN